MKAFFILVSAAAVISATVLGDSAASMAPGTWKRMDPAIPNNLYNQYGSIFVYSNDAVWDASTGKLMFWGRDHGDPWQGIIYEVNTNTWKSAPLAFDPMAGGHTYDNLAMDFNQHVVYHFDEGKRLFKFNPVSETWSTPAQNGAPSTTGHGMSISYFPEMGGLVHVYGSFGTISFFDLSTSTWRQLATGLAMGPYHNLGEYDPVHHCVIAGGGNGSGDFYKVDSTGAVTALKDAPFGIGIHQCELTCDRVSGTYLALRNDSLYGYDVQYDYWFNLGPNPGIDNVLSVVTPMPEYGVVAFLYRNLWLYKYAGPHDTLPVASVTLRAQQTTIEQYLWTYVDVVAAYQGGARDTSNTKCGFICLDTNILGLSSTGGKVTGKTLGQGRIVVLKRGATDTLTITVVPSTAQLDSIRLSVDTLKLFPAESYPIVATGYFHKNSQAFSRPVQAEASWNSPAPSTAEVAQGVVTGVAAGGPVTVTASIGSVSDAARVIVYPALSFIRRINFQVSSTPWSYGWLADNGQAYSAAQGYGWGASLTSSSRDDRLGNHFLLKSLVSAPSGSTYRIDAPAGSYIVKIAMGDNQYGVSSYNWTAFGTDTVCRKPAGTANGIQVDTITVTGNSAVFTVSGPVNYIVMISNQGVDINAVADDGGTAVPLPPSRLENNLSAEPGLLLYPNPVRSVVNIRLSGLKALKAGIFSVNGRMIRDLSPELGNRPSVRWNAGSAPSGVYFVRVEAGGKVLQRPLILIR